MPRPAPFVLLGVVLTGACEQPPGAAPPPVAAPPPAEVVRECATQPCCGDPPRPCGAVIDDAVGKPCTTACDCSFPGLACHEGACRSGSEAVFCCGACPAHAPAAQRCQRPDGSYARCG